MGCLLAKVLISLPAILSTLNIAPSSDVTSPLLSVTLGCTAPRTGLSLEDWDVMYDPLSARTTACYFKADSVRE